MSACADRSTAGNAKLLEILVSKARTWEGGQEGRIRDIDTNANVRLVSAKRLDKRQKPAALLEGIGWKQRYGRNVC